MAGTVAICQQMMIFCVDRKGRQKGFGATVANKGASGNRKKTSDFYVIVGEGKLLIGRDTATEMNIHKSILEMSRRNWEKSRM